MAISITHAAVSEPGLRFPANEDRWFADPDLGLYLVADGMADVRAAEIIVERLPGMLQNCSQSPETWSDPKIMESVRLAMMGLSMTIRDQARSQPDEPEMGATMVLTLLRPKQALIGQLGTCRAYLWREGFLEQLTRDQSVVQRYLSLGVLKPEQLSSFPLGSGPTGYMGMNGEPAPAVRMVPLFPGDQLLLTSAGFTQAVSDWQMHDLLNQPKSLEETCRRLGDAAKEAGARDSSTVLMVAMLET
jgi:protein phosphatase